MKISNILLASIVSYSIGGCVDGNKSKENFSYAQNTIDSTKVEKKDSTMLDSTKQHKPQTKIDSVPLVPIPFEPEFDYCPACGMG